MSIKISNPKPFPAIITTKTQESKRTISARESRDVRKDEWMRYVHRKFSKTASERKLPPINLIIHISQEVSTEKLLPWWTDELTKLLPHMAFDDTKLDEKGIDSLKLFNTLKTIASDKSYLNVDLSETIIE